MHRADQGELKGIDSTFKEAEEMSIRTYQRENHYEIHDERIASDNTSELLENCQGTDDFATICNQFIQKYN